MQDMRRRVTGKLPDDGAFSPISTYRAQLGEGPAWDAERQSLWWVDGSSKALINTALDGTETVWTTPEAIGFVVLAFDAIIVGLETGLFAFAPASGHFERVLAFDAPDLRCNDAAVGLGCIWAGRMDREAEKPIGDVLRIGPDFTPVRCLDGYRRPNGLAVDAARRRLYVSDSHPLSAGIAVADLAPATLAMGMITSFGGPGRPGRPDGAALDATGNYWIARVDAGLIDVLAPDGALLGSVPVPVPEPTKPAFGGPDMRTLFVTSKAGGALGGRLLSAPLDAIWPAVDAGHA